LGWNRVVKRSPEKFSKIHFKLRFLWKRGKIGKKADRSDGRDFPKGKGEPF
jgi:hypothetical protein